MATGTVGGVSASEPMRIAAAAATTVVLWASAFVVLRYGVRSYGPGELSLLRMLVGTAALTVFVVRRGIRIPTRRTWAGIAAMGIAWFGAYNVALNAAEREIDAGTAAMLVNLAPLLVVLGAGLFLGEGFPRALLIGAPLSFAGVVLIALSSSSSHATLIGVLLAILAAVLYAGSTLIQKRLLGSVDGLTITWLAAIAGTVVLLPWAPSLIAQITEAPAPATWGVVYLGVFPTAIAFATWAYVLTRVSAGRTSMTSYAVPAITIVLSWLFLAEAPLTLVGGAMCLLGVGISRVRPRRSELTAVGEEVRGGSRDAGDGKHGGPRADLLR